MPNWKKVIVSGSDATLNSLNLTNATSGATVFSIDGTHGRLFSITDELSGSLFAVSDISGIPSFEVFSDDTVKIGTHNSESIVVSGSELKLSHLSTQGSETDVLTINGSNVVGTRQLSSGAFASAYSLPLATSSTRGGVKIGYSENGKNYPVELSSEKMYVNVPWSDTNTQLSDAQVRSKFSAGTNVSISEEGVISATDTNTDTNTVTQIRRDNTGTYRTGNINLVGGSNVTISEGSAGVFTIAATDTNTDTNTTYQLKAQKNDGSNSNPILTLDASAGSDDTVQFSGGGATTVTRGDDASITISSTDTNTQLSTAQVRAKFSAGTNVSITDGVISATDTNTDTNTQNTYSTSVVSSSGIKLRLTGAGHNGATTDDVKFAGSGATSVSRTDASTITISSTDTNTQLSNEEVIGVFSAGENITISDSGEISATDTNTDTNTVTSIRRDNTGTYRTGNINLVGGSNVTISESPNGTFTFASTDTNTQATRGSLGLDTDDTPAFAGLTLSGVANPQISFNGSSDAGVDMAIKATPEALQFFEPEDSNKVHFEIKDDTGVSATYGYQVNGTTVITSGRALQNVSGNISMFTNDSGYKTTDNNTVTSIRRDNTGTYRTGNINLVGGSNVTITESPNGTFTFASTDTNTDTNTFRRIDVNDGDSTATLGNTETLELKAGTNVGLTESNGVVTFSSTDTNTQLSTAQVRAKISAGTGISYDSSTGVISSTVTDTNTNTQNTYSVSIPSSTTKLRLSGAGHNGNTTDDIEFVGSGATTVTRTNDSKFTISSTDTNTQLSTAQVRAKISGTGLISYDEETGVISTSANSYSLPAATATTRGGVELFSNTVQSTSANTVSSTASRTYGVQVNSAAQMVVNVPWERTRFQFNSSGLSAADFSLIDGSNASFKHQGGNTYSIEAGDTTYTADGNYGLTLSGTTFRLENDRRRNSSTVDIYSGNTHDFTWYDADVGIRWYVAGVEDMRLQNGGTLQVDGDVVAYSSTISDERLKDNVTTIKNPLDKIKELRGVEYDWNAGSRKGKRDLGLIAQEVEKVIPNIVHEHEQPFLNDDEDDKTLYKTVDYEKMVAVLIEGMKEQQSQIDELKSEINQLKGKV